MEGVVIPIPIIAMPMPVPVGVFTLMPYTVHRRVPAPPARKARHVATVLSFVISSCHRLLRNRQLVHFELRHSLLILVHRHAETHLLLLLSRLHLNARELGEYVRIIIYDGWRTIDDIPKL